ncbi:hypothetical protein ColKHC_08243 [Colletotrichum higginsianum]|nr:hypothetical protein ColKHC_08243 [Colletotrichum higginsianum]
MGKQRWRFARVAGVPGKRGFIGIGVAAVFGASGGAISAGAGGSGWAYVSGRTEAEEKER